MRGLQIDYETADRIALCVMQDQLRYLLQEQEWFEASEEQKKVLAEQMGRTLWVHPEDYAKNASDYIPALKTLIAYFSGNVQ
jgi:hypothetical protein